MALLGTPHLIGESADTKDASQPSAQNGPSTAPAVENPQSAIRNPQSAQPTTESSGASRVIEQISAPPGVIAVKLADGLAVIIKPTSAAPVVDVRAYVHTGSLYEGKWLGCGLSHLCEHLVANDAGHDAVGGIIAPAATHAKRPRNKVDQIGGSSNAYTTDDHTCYYISASAAKAMDCVDLVSEWMINPVITKADFEREHQVVQRELEMGLDSAGRMLGQAHEANVYGTHPAASPTIGFPEPLAKLTWDDFYSYYKMTYQPQNMVFVVVGDVDSQAVLQRIVKNFGAADHGRSIDHNLPDVQPLTGVRRVTKPFSTLKEVQEEGSFLTVSMLDDDMYALDVLSTILGDGQTSRLVRKLQRSEPKLATQVGCYSSTPSWGLGQFGFYFHSTPANAQAAESAILAELKAVVDQGVTADELARAKRQIAAQHVYEQQTVDSQAAQLGRDYMFTRDIAFSDHYVERAQKVTAEQIKQVAAKYFNFDAMAITRMVPPQMFSPEQAAAAATAKAETTTFALPNGLKVVLHPDSVGLVSMVLATRGGLLLETPQTNGMGSVMTSLCTKGAGKLSADEIAEFFENAGGGISATAGNNSFLWNCTVLADGFDKAMDIFADVVLRPTFSQKELDILRPQLDAGIDRIDQDLSGDLMRHFKGDFFKGSPYAMLPSGTKEVLAKATPESIAQYHKQALKAGDSVLAVYGSFDPAAARKRIEQLFADMPGGKATVPAPKPEVVAEQQLKVYKTTNTMAGVIVAVPGMALENLQDRFPMDVLKVIISGWQMPSGWLHEELRGQGLVYSVHTQNFAGLAPGAYFAIANTQPQNAAKVVDIIKANFRKMTEYQPTQAEIDEATNMILSAEVLGTQTMDNLASGAALNELYGFGWDFNKRLDGYYHKVTPADVARVAKKYLASPDFIVVTTPQPEVMEKH
jgi:zinc protease